MKKNNSLSIYFGPKLINIVEYRGKKIISDRKVMLAPAVFDSLQQKVPDELKVVSLIKGELDKVTTEAKEASVVLSGRDLIVRTFEVPVLAASELKNAVNFEVRKYIPFKIEDLVSNFKITSFDRRGNKDLVLFLGIKKATLEKYIFIISQLGFKLISVEYSAFSILRLFKLTKSYTNGIICVVTIDLAEEDEVNFMVLEGGFPLFSRDFTHASEASSHAAKTEEDSSETILEKIKKEIRISLEYYYRKYPAKKIHSVFSLANKDYQAELNTFFKDMGLLVKFADFNKYTNRPFSLGIAKSYSSAFSNIIRIVPEMNLFGVKKELKGYEKIISVGSEFKIEPRILISNLLICSLIWLFGFYRIAPLKRELNNIVRAQSNVPLAKRAAGVDEINNTLSSYKTKIESLDKLLQKKIYLTEILDAVSRVHPEDVYLKKLFFKAENDKNTLFLEGVILLQGDVKEKEIELLNKFHSGLKENYVLAKYFKVISIQSTEGKKFVIRCGSVKEIISGDDQKWN